MCCARLFLVLVAFLACVSQSRLLCLWARCTAHQGNLISGLCVNRNKVGWLYVWLAREQTLFCVYWSPIAVSIAARPYSQLLTSHPRVCCPCSLSDSDLVTRLRLLVSSCGFLASLTPEKRSWRVHSWALCLLGLRGVYILSF